MSIWIIGAVLHSGVNGKPVYHIFRNDEIRKEYLSTGY